MTRKKLVIVGGGFGGLNAAKTVAGKKDLAVTLIDRQNHHLFQPLLYQVAMAGLSPAEIAYPIRSLLASDDNCQVLLATVEGVDYAKKQVTTDQGPVDYDYLILACGAKHAYFGNEEWEPFAPGLKNLEQATEIRRRVLMAFEQAETATDPEQQKRLLTFVVVGGGPTGVELAGALGEISRFTLARDFRKIDPNRTRIILVEAGERILAGFHPDLARKAARSLEGMGVQVWTQSRVTEVNAQGVRLREEFLHAQTVLWAAGVKPSSLNEKLGAPLDPIGRVIIEDDLSLPGHPDVFVIGDQALCRDKAGKELPGIAPVAMQQGIHAGKTVLRLVQGKASEPFKYFDKGIMATIGRRTAVLESGRIRMHGLLAWIAWLLIHIFYLVGFKNRIFVMIQWAWHYFSFGRGARLIVGKSWQFYNKSADEEQ